MAGDLESELARVVARDDVVRAWVVRHDDEAVRRAAAQAPAGRLSGWTIGVKDVIDTSDLPTERGSPIFRDRQTGNDASCVAMVRQAGAVIPGKTVTTEFALFSPGVTTNPHDASRTPGGSSSGSAAAVADGHVRAAFGTQTVGSVIRPAAYCGVTGFKPTYQVVPTTGVATLAHSFDTVGWLTRDVADARTLFEVLADPTAAVSPSGELATIGVYRSHQWEAAQPETEPLLVDAARRLEAAGHSVRELEPLPHLAGVFEAADVVLHYEIARVFAWERHGHHDDISHLVQKMLLRADRLTFDDYAAARQVLDNARAAHTAALDQAGIDLLLTPSAPGEAPPIATTGDSVFNRVWTALGVPALHLPTSKGPAGLPLGVQLTGRRFGDRSLLDAALSIEHALEAK